MDELFYVSYMGNVSTAFWVKYKLCRYAITQSGLFARAHYPAAATVQIMFRDCVKNCSVEITYPFLQSRQIALLRIYQENEIIQFEQQQEPSRDIGIMPRDGFCFLVFRGIL